MSEPDPEELPLPFEVAAVWALFALVTVEILVTYSRIPAHELYHFDGSGLVKGGLSRALVFLNFPTALVAIAVLGVVFERLRGHAMPSLAVVAAVLCAAVFWPGIVSQANLDAKPANAIAGIGVLLALALTVALGASRGVGPVGRRPGDLARIVVALVLLVVSAPWVAADLGFFLTGVPVLGGIFRTEAPFPDAPPFTPSVHHGHHHGMDGFILILTVLLLSRALVRIRARGLRIALTGYLAVMLCYGIGNLLNDFWTEQVWKRGWVSRQLPSVLEPKPTAAWAVVLATAAAMWVVALRRQAS